MNTKTELYSNYYLAYYMSWHKADYFNLKMNDFYQTVVYALEVVPLVMAYTGLFMLSFQKNSSKKVSILAPVGKMAFSNYIMQS